MRSHATTRVLLTAAAFIASGPIAADNTVQCNDPPGSSVTCETSQAAFCNVRNRRVHGKCQTVPESSTDSEEIKAWALSRILGREVRVEQLEQEPFKSYLESGTIRTPAGKDTCRRGHV